MRVFLDTNVFLDMMIPRDNIEDNKNACRLLALSANKKFKFCVSPITIATTYYIMRKDAHAARRVEERLANMDIVPVGEDQVRFSLCFDIFPDREDAMLMSAAFSNECEVILTRDEAHFVNSPVPCYTPSEFLGKIR